MFGVGPTELVIIGAVALIIFGPSRLPEVAGQVGKWVRDFRRMSADLTAEFQDTLAEVEDVKRSVKRELQGLTDEFDDRPKSKPGAKAPLKGGAATVKAGSTAKTATAAKAAKPVASGTAAAKPKALPLATKADPLSDVSLLDDGAFLPVVAGTNGAVGSNGFGTATPAADDALARVRQRRAAAGYNRRP